MTDTNLTNSLEPFAKGALHFSLFSLFAPEKIRLNSCN
jgi:hypothetical protein